MSVISVNYNTCCVYNTYVLAISPVIHIGRATHSYMKETHLSGIHMDRELETYTELAVESFSYRNGIFRGLWDRWMTAVAFYRAGVDARGAITAKRRMI